MIGSFTIAISEIVGKKLYIFVMSALLILSQYLIFFMKGYNARVVLMIIFGFANAKFIVVYIHILENMPKRIRSQIGLMILALECLVSLFNDAYFMLISKDWRWLYLVSMILGPIALLIQAFLPNSPIHYVNRKEYHESIQLMNRIARINGHPPLPTDIILEEEEYDDKSNQDESHAYSLTANMV